MQKKILASLILAALILSSVPYVTPVSAATTALMMDPPSIINPALTPGKNITIMVKVQDAVDMFAYEFKVYFRNSILNATKAQRPPGHFLQPLLDPSNQFQVKWEIKNNFNATHGRLWLSFTLLSPEVGRTGSGNLVQITFRVIGVGTTPLRFADTKMSDSVPLPIVHVAEGSQFSNKPPPAPAQIYVDPEKTVDVTLVPSSNFMINVSILDATDVYAFQFKLGYDPSIIEAVDLQEGTFLSNVGTTSVLASEINNPLGYVLLSVTLTGATSASGSGTLGVITFHVLGMGTSALTLSDTALKDSAAQLLPHTTKDGSFANVILAKLFIDPPLVEAPFIRPGYIFTVDVKVENVEDLHGYEFYLSYDTDVLTCIGVMVLPALTETRFTNRFSVDDGIGETFVNVTYWPTANPISTIPPVSIVTMYFKFDAMGSSNVTFHDTKLVDVAGDPIPHSAEGAFFHAVIRDVAVIFAQPMPTFVYEGRIVNITVIATNIGELVETFDVIAYYDSNVIGTKTISNLAPGENATLFFLWDTTGLPPMATYTIKAEALPVPFEFDLTNNLYVDGTVQVRKMGDVDGDGDVDLYDLVAVAMAFGSQPGDPNWNPDADLVTDGVIDIFDLVTVVINYGK